MKEVLTIKKIEEQVIEVYKKVQAIDLTEYASLMDQAGCYPQGVGGRDEYSKIIKQLLKYTNGLMNKIIDAKLLLDEPNLNQIERSLEETMVDINNLQQEINNDTQTMKEFIIEYID